MSFLLTHALYAAFIAALSAVLTLFLVKNLTAMDVPNERSSHTRLTPRGGGLAIVISFLMGIVMIQFLGDATPIYSAYFLGFMVSALVIGLMSLYDDFHTVSFTVKLGGQLVAVLIAMYAGILIDIVRLPVLGEVDIGLMAYPLTLLWLMGMANAYNFIDGLDGFAAGTALIAAAFFSYITFDQGSGFIYLASLTLCAGTLGFLVFNWPPAKIFMGDVGSTFLGFTFAVMAIIAARYDHSHTSLFVMPLLLFHFIFDASFTFLRRLLAGENVFAGHRTHLYQLLNRLGYSHGQVSLVYSGLAVAQGLAAVWMVERLGAERLYVFLPFLLGYLICAWWVVAKARREGIG